MTEEQAAEFRYEAGMYQSLYDAAKARIGELETAAREIIAAAECRVLCEQATIKIQAARIKELEAYSAEYVQAIDELEAEATKRGASIEALEVVALKAALAKCNARIKALEAVLRSLLKEPPSILDDPDTDAQIVIRMRKIARAALDKDAGQ